MGRYLANVTVVTQRASLLRPPARPRNQAKTDALHCIRPLAIKRERLQAKKAAKRSS